MRTDDLFPPEVVTVIELGDWDPPPLLPDEEQFVSRAVPRRRREFAGGRACARAALARLGVAECSIPAGRGRAPSWPAGIVGSITHCDGLIGAAVARRGKIVSVGFDAEPATPLDDEIVETICTPSETRWTACTPAPEPSGWPKIIFSAKEALHKCIWPESGVMLDFHDVELEVATERELFVVRFVCQPRAELPDCALLEGRYAVRGAHVLTGFVNWSTD